MSYPIHFRKKILAKLEEGQSIRAVAQHFEINKNTIVEWKKRIEIKRTRPRKPSKVDDDALRADVEQYPDDYQYERVNLVSFIVKPAFRFNTSLKRIRNSSNLI
jgi:transposase